MDQKTIAINMMVTGPFPSQIAARGAQMQTFGNQANAGMAKAQTGMQKFGTAATKVATFGLLAVVAGLALSAKAAIDFESSFAGIRKTVTCRFRARLRRSEPSLRSVPPRSRSRRRSPSNWTANWLGCSTSCVTGSKTPNATT